MHAGERRAAALEHRGALAVALERLGRRRGDEPGEERRRQPLAVDDDRLAALELREQVVAALARAAAAHDAARDLVTQVLAERRLRIQARDRSAAARASAIVVGDRERGAGAA